MKKKSKDLSIIDKDLVLDGTVNAQGELIVRGRMTGILNAQQVVIAEGGNVRGEADVVRMTIGGKFDGKVVAAEKLVVLSTGKCFGRVVCKTIVIEAGGILNAQVSIIQDRNRADGEKGRNADSN